MKQGGCCFSAVVVGRVGQIGGGGQRMSIRSAHRAHGLDTNIYIYLHTYFLGILSLFHDIATFWYSLIPCIMYTFCV